ncbi:hypothetical protein ACWEGE_24685 [Amycolatopsis sp. NPDC004747]
MPRTTRTLAAVAAAAACLLTAAEASEASTAPVSASASAETGKYCAVLVGKAAAPDGVSPELSRACSDVSRDDARRHLNRPGARTAGEAEVAASARLMAWYADTYYTGETKDIYGSDGTCDYSGYRLIPNSDWRQKLSSAKGYGLCTWGEFYNPTQILKFSSRLPVPWFGPELNDNVGVVKVYRVD